MESAYITETILRMTFSLVDANLSCWVKQRKGKKMYEQMCSDKAGFQSNPERV